MVLVDTSVSVAHFRGTEPGLAGLLLSGAVLMHPAVMGELACGNLPHRIDTLAALMQLRTAAVGRPSDVVTLIETRRLFGIGIGWVDAQLLTSARLSSCPLWTMDPRLRDAATKADVHVYE